MNILKEAHEIVYERAEEKERQYGPFKEGLERAAKIATNMGDFVFDSKDICIALIALKLSRESYNHKTDNLLDAVAYTSILNDILNDIENEK